MNDKQILTEILSIYDLFSPPSLKRLRHFSECYEFLVFIEIWTKFGPDEKRKGIPIPRCTPKEAALVYFEELFFKKNKRKIALWFNGSV